MKKIALQPAVEDKYKLKDIEPGLYHFPVFGEINLSELSLEQADALVEKGFPYLIPKKKKQGPAEGE